MISEQAKIDLIGFGKQLQHARHGEKSNIVDGALSHFGWDSHHTFYRELKKLGWTSGKQTRKDAGSTSQDEQSLLMLAAMSKTSARANGKTLMETPNAISVLSQNGFKFTSPSNVNRILRGRNLTAKQMKQDTTHGHFRTEFPNQVHLVDPSLCVLYYPPGSTKGMRVQKYTTMQEQYKNKPEMLEKIKNLRVWRYVMVDHFSGLVSVKYYESAGESQEILYDFLIWAWAKASGSPFHGLPRTMYWDKGSANTSKAIRYALSCLSVEDIAHTTHLARAKGAVEQANNLVEKLLEGRLLFEPVNSVEELNVVAANWQNAYNANLIPNYNAKHNRHGMARTDAWLKIMQPEFIHHLRELPAADYCRYIFTHEPVLRTVSGELEITFRHPVAKKSLTYSVADIEGIHAKKKILVNPIVLGNDAKVLVTIAQPLGHDIKCELAPVVFNEMGFRVDSPVFGEGFDTKKDSAVDTNQKALDRVAFPNLLDADIEKAKAKKVTPFEAEIDAISHIKDIYLPAAITPKGSALDLPSEFVPTPAKPLTPLALKRAVINALGRDLEQSDIDVMAKYEEVFVEDIDAIVAEILRPKLAALKLVNNS
jgi:hypothetical protein